MDVYDDDDDIWIHILVVRIHPVPNPFYVLWQHIPKPKKICEMEHNREKYQMRILYRVYIL